MEQIVTAITISLAIIIAVSGSRSIGGLVSLAKMERHIYSVIQAHSDSDTLLLQNPLLVQEYLTDFSESSLNIFQDLDQNDHHTFAFPHALRIAKNPIMSYRMVRRYARLLGPLYKELPIILREEILKKIGKIGTEIDILSEWPSGTDLDEAMDALLRIHHVYNVNLEEFTSGKIMGTETGVELTGQQCHEIGEFALGLNRFTSAILWLETALNKAKMSNDLGLTDKILTTTQLATESHDVAWKDKKERDYFYFQQKLNETGTEKRVSVREVESERRKWKQYELFDCDVRVWGLCSGENYQTDEEISQLFCWYEMKMHGSSGSWRINPLKIELLSISPYLIQIHDVLKNQTIEAFKKEGNPRLRKTPRWDTNFVPNFSDSYFGYLAPSVLTRSLSRRIELMTGLSVTPSDAAENFAIKGYAPGGEDACHLDYSARQDHRLDNRVATILFYLEDVEMGGYTAFPAIGVSAKPIRGSAIFWYNMLRNGRADVRTEHMGCPVVLGQKLVSIKSIRVNAQIHTRPCDLSKDE